MKILIVEKDPETLSTFESCFCIREEIMSVVVTNDVKEALDYLSEHEIDLILMDIDPLPSPSATLLKKLINIAPLIMMSASPLHAAEAYELGSLDYLVKPISLERSIKAFLKFKTLCSTVKQKSKHTFFIKLNHQILKLRYDQILFIEADGDYVNINTEETKYLVNMGIGMVEDLLKDRPFARIHRSFIVSIEKIDRIVNNKVVVKSLKLPIGSAYKNSFYDALNILY